MGSAMKWGLREGGGLMGIGCAVKVKEGDSKKGSPRASLFKMPRVYGSNPP